MIGLVFVEGTVLTAGVSVDSNDKDAWELCDRPEDQILLLNYLG